MQSTIISHIHNSLYNTLALLLLAPLSYHEVYIHPLPNIASDVKKGCL